MLLLSGCSSCNKGSQEPVKPETRAAAVPVFNADSAYSFVKAQCDFGPRVPNTKEHDACGKYLAEKLKSYTPDVIVQTGTVTTYDHVRLNIQNIIASFNPPVKADQQMNRNRILLFAHWDTRPWADQDPVEPRSPFLAADDAGSGVAVLLEIARMIAASSARPAVGIDIALFDAEDWGAKNSTLETEDSYALGTQYWARQPHVPGYTASYGILLDMVGGRGAAFRMEGNSKQYAQFVVDKVWNAAVQNGFSGYFLFKDGGWVTDDHVYVNKIINIPSIDIIPSDMSTASGFPLHWHTHSDNMDVIDKNTLQAVGQTLLHVIYAEGHP